jgi:hypothetical protein
MLGGIYAILAIAGWVSLCALIAWFVGRVIDYIGNTRENEAREFADSDSRTAALRNRLIEGTGQRIGAYRASANPSDTRNTHSVLLSGPLSGTEA